MLKIVCVWIGSRIGQWFRLPKSKHTLFWINDLMFTLDVTLKLRLVQSYCMVSNPNIEGNMWIWSMRFTFWILYKVVKQRLWSNLAVFVPSSWQPTWFNMIEIITFLTYTHTFFLSTLPIFGLFHFVTLFPMTIQHLWNYVFKHSK